MSTTQEDTLPSKLSDTDNSSSKELLALIAQNSSSNKNKEQALDKHLKLSPPVTTQNSIEYNQVFRMVPNKNFYSLYNRCYRANNPTQTLPENDLVNRSAYLKRIQIIDRRPKRWYQTLAKLSSQIAEITYNKGLLEKNLNYLKKSMSEFGIEDKFGGKQADYHALKKQYKKNLNKLLELNNVLIQYDYLVNQVIDEISSAGYLYYKDKESNQVKIRKPIPEQTVQPPLKPEEIQTVNEEKWKVMLADLKSKLFMGENKLITAPEKKQKFDTNSAELSSTQSCPIIQDFLTKIQNEINAYQQELNTLNQIDRDKDPIVIKAKSDCDTQIANCDQEINRCNNLIQKAEKPLIDAYGPINEDNPNTIKLINYFLLNKYQGTEDFQTLKNKISSNKQLKETAQKNKDTAIDDFKRSLDEKLKAAESKRSDAQARKDAYDANQVLKEERIKFLLFWNDPENYDNQKIIEKDIDPEKDPLQHFYHHISKTKASNSKPYHIHRFTYLGDGYYDEKLLSLVEFMELPDLVNRIAIFPFIDDNGQTLPDVFRIIIEPQKPGITAAPEMPVVKLVETHELNVSWQHYALGELKSAINLAPGEKKQIVVEKQTKITRQVNESRTDSSNQQRNITSSFEDNLTNELSNSYNLSKSDENSKAYKQDQSNSNNSSLQNDVNNN